MIIHDNNPNQGFFCRGGGEGARGVKFKYGMGTG